MTTAQGLDASTERAWALLHAISEAVPAAVDSQLRRDAGVTRYEYYALRMLSKAPEQTMLMSELAAATNGSASRLSHAADRLEKAGWIRRRPFAADRRATTATLTVAGEQKLADSTPGHVDAVRSLIFDQLTPTQTTALRDALEPLAAALHLAC